MTSNDHPGGRVGLQSLHRPPPRLESTMVALLILLLPYRSLLRNATADKSAMTCARTGARSVTTSSGWA